MKYVIMEIQTASDGSVATLTHQADTRLEAESIYHQMLAAAAISQLPKHAAILMTNEGFPVMHMYYGHVQAEPVTE